MIAQAVGKHINWSCLLLAALAIASLVRFIANEHSTPGLHRNVKKKEAELIAQLHTLPGDVSLADQRRLNLEIDLAKLYQSNCQFGQALQTATAAINACGENYPQCAELRTLAGDICKDGGGYQQADRYYREALQLHQQNKNSTAAASCLTDLAALSLMQSRKYGTEYKERYLLEAEHLLDQAQKEAGEQSSQKIARLIYSYRELVRIEAGRFQDLQKLMIKDEELN